MEFLMGLEWHLVAMGACNDSKCCCFCFDTEEGLNCRFWSHKRLFEHIYSLNGTNNYIPVYIIGLSTRNELESTWFIFYWSRDKICMRIAWSLLFSYKRVILVKFKEMHFKRVTTLFIQNNIFKVLALRRIKSELQKMISSSFVAAYFRCTFSMIQLIVYNLTTRYSFSFQSSYDDP